MFSPYSLPYIESAMDDHDINSCKFGNCEDRDHNSTILYHRHEGYTGNEPFAWEAEGKVQLSHLGDKCVVYPCQLL